MKSPRPSCRSLLLLVCLLALAFASSGSKAVASYDDWRPLDPGDLALRAPVVEKDADAEAIFWEVKVDDASQDLVFSHYIRIKVFTERGRESQSKIEIPFGRIGRLNIKIRDIAARTIKPDGQIIELKNSDVFERTVVKSSGVKIRVKSFAMPGVEPGAIIEYRWREALPGVSAQYTRLQFQRDIPVQRVTYYVKPLSNPYINFALRYHPFQMDNPRFVKDKNGFYSTQMTNVPAFREESRMPPEDTVRQWMLLYYTEDRKLTPQRYWPDYGRRIYEAYKPYMK
ncbi:MAG: DUF3857 domain-containing protein, partial [Pyrinomonadaceae bacterium]|nr:DUF3857 domain-containing protein [Pyrinomonadaceae bacterium]